jgi:hypothetical protein
MSKLGIHDDEHAASETPHASTAMTRYMINPPSRGPPGCIAPGPTIRAASARRNRAPPSALTTPTGASRPVRPFLPAPRTPQARADAATISQNAAKCAANKVKTPLIGSLEINHIGKNCKYGNGL